MTPAEAAKLLELPADATIEQLEARFLDLRRKLEDKVAKAPTPGLQAKYRETLAQITTAFETLTLAADSSSLPVLQKPSAVSSQPSAGGPAATRAAAPAPNVPHSAARQPKSNKEFLIVALIAVAVLGAGGWFVMKTRAEKAEQARVAAELAQKAANEKAGAELAAKTEADRLTTQTTVLRTKLAEARVEWEAIESNAQDAERQASDLKSELRGLRDAPPQKKTELSVQVTAQELYAAWLKNYLLRHPAKIARARTEELLQAKDVDAATATCEEMEAALAKATEAINDRRGYFFDSTGNLELATTPPGVKWILTDPYGQTREGETPAELHDLPLTHLYTGGAPGTGDKVRRSEFAADHYALRFVRKGWPDVTEDFALVATEPHESKANFPEGNLEIRSKPAGLKFTVTQKANLGWTATGTAPAVLTGVPVGDVKVNVERPDYGSRYQIVEITPGGTARTLELDIVSQAVNIAVAEAQAKIFVDKKFVGRGQAKLLDLVPGQHALQIEAEGYLPYRTKFAVEVSNKDLPVFRYNIKELAVENLKCPKCGATGIVQRVETCQNCGGRGWEECGTCDDSGYEWVDRSFLAGGGYKQRCSACNGTKRRPCGFFGHHDGECTGDGIARWKETCQACGGDGRVSPLQLSQSL